MNKVVTQFAVLLAVALLAEPVRAYIGPGAGLSAFGVVLALFSAILLMIAGFVWYPVKRLMNRKKKARPADEESEDHDPKTAREARDAQPEER
jgi:uncharacterized membrane protein